MCFSNLPLEFDEDGNPYLAEEADDIERPGEHDHAADCGCGTAEGDLDADPEAAYETIVESLPEAAREHVAGDDNGPATRPESVGGD
ncbi:MAG: hypothetical protein ABEJ43_04555 [Haloferacaceae archaeon]